MGEFMKNVKKFGIFAVVGIVIWGLVIGGISLKEKMDAIEKPWKLGHIRPSGATADIDVLKFIDEINSNSDGAINIDIYPAGQLGDYQVVQERIGIGDIEMQLAPAGTNVDKSLGISSVPYLITNWSQAKKVFRRDGPLIENINEKFENQNIKLLASYPVYFGGIALVKEPIEPGNPNVPKNIKIRVPGMKAYELNAQSLGYLATPIPYSEAFTAIQTGIVDGAIGSGAEGYYASFRDVTNYYLPVNDHFEIWFLYMNLELWNSLSENEKKIIEEAGLKFEERRFSVAEEDQKKFEDKLRDKGIVVYEFTDEELETMATKSREEVWPEVQKRFGTEIFDIIEKDLAE
jgi:TRAP-type C4-dicarboxylate transport system substrate-binding protein